MRCCLLATGAALLLLSGCGGNGASSDPAANGAKNVSGETKGESETDPNASADERKFIDSAVPFARAISQQKYADAYALLSSHAKARMSRNQFAPENDDKMFDANEKAPITNVSAEKFADLMKLVEKNHGQPQRFSNMHVFSLKADILAGRPKEQEDRLDVMFAIGNMPQSIPANIRKASLRLKVHTMLSDAELARVAKEEGTTVEELKKSEDFDPYFNLKIVLVEEDGLKVGYFEFLPPSMMD